VTRRRAAWLTGAVLLVTAAHAASEPRGPAAPSAARTHVVGRGETLGAIAARYKVPVAALVAANGLRGERATLRVGRHLVIPTPATATRPPAPRPAAAARPTASSRRTARVTREPDARPPRPSVTRGPRGLDLAVPDFVDDTMAFAWPLDGPVSSPFGRRRSAWHRGIDIRAEPGSLILAAAPGRVVASGIEPRYGRVVKIEHDDGFVTVYAHNEENLVGAGARVAAGDPIATVGRTGRATAPHLHFEIRRNGAVYNPLYLLPLPPRVGQVEESAEPEEEHE
jgi:murein DD-endopeptidase MepM/ murein hydrolase activator NlpD